MNLSNDHNSEIVEKLPQKYPFVMVDELVTMTGKRLIAKLTIREDNIFVEDGLLHEPGILEHIAQSAGLRPTLESLQNNTEVPQGYFAAINNFELYDLPRVHSQIETTIVTKLSLKTGLIISSVSHCGETTICKSDMHFYLKN